MYKIDPLMKPEMDEFGHPVHYVAKCFPGLHLGETCEVWSKYWKTGTGTWDVKVYKMRFENGDVSTWEDLPGYVEKHAPFAMELIKQLGKEYKLQ